MTIERDRTQGLYIVRTEGGNRSIWYDPQLRLWTEQTNDAEGNQIGTVDYDVDRAAAFAWLKGEGVTA